MQIFDSQNYADKQHGLYLTGPGDIAFHGIDIPDHTLWRWPEPTWQMDDLITEQHMTNQFGYYGEEPKLPLAGSSINDYHWTTHSHIPSEEWPSAPPLDTSCDKYDTPAAPAVESITPPTPQNHVVTSPGILVPVNELERDESMPPIPTSPETVPTIRKKRTRNRLAAARCRKKAKRGVDELQQRERDLLRENKMLGAEAYLLREELLLLKCEVLRHSACDNDYIRHYIQSAAEEEHVEVQSEDSPWGSQLCRVPANRDISHDAFNYPMIS
ncbi:hypothetical protein F5X97DRAFT_320586 [Nemania serpens]|nr:hypothetical protein F5X97DRAFT_320586 [Nemania serpens]